MPKAFSKEEKGRIRERLLEAGEEMFTRYGLRKTTVEELVQAAGIAKGSFYLFFPSKETLYAELLLRRVPAVQARVLAKSLHATEDAREAIVRFQEEIVREMEADELVRRIVLDPSELEQLIHGVPAGPMHKEAMNLGKPIFDWVRAAQERGEVIEGDPRIVGSMLGMIKFLPAHQDDLDPAIYPKLMKLMVQVIADGLTCPAKKVRKG